MLNQKNSTVPRLGNKFEPPKDPIELENAKRIWEMPQIQKMAYIERKFQEKQAQIDGANMRPDDKLAKKNAMQVYLQQMELEAWDAEATECYIREFRDFLQGKSKYNTDDRYKHLVPWRNHKLVGKDIDAYLDAVLDKKIEFDAKIAKMFNTKMAPRTIQDAWLYFVFICTGKKPPTDIFLKAWDAFYPYGDDMNGTDNPQKNWKKTPEDAPPRENQKGVLGPKESCDQSGDVNPILTGTKPQQGESKPQEPVVNPQDVPMDIADLPVPTVVPPLSQEAVQSQTEAPMEGLEEERLKRNRVEKRGREDEETNPRYPVRITWTPEALNENVAQSIAPEAAANADAIVASDAVIHRTNDEQVQDRRAHSVIDRMERDYMEQYFNATKPTNDRYEVHKELRRVNAKAHQNKWRIVSINQARGITSDVALTITNEQNNQIHNLNIQLETLHNFIHNVRLEKDALAERFGLLRQEAAEYQLLTSAMTTESAAKTMRIKDLVKQLENTRNELGNIERQYKRLEKVAFRNQSEKTDAELQTHRVVMELGGALNETKAKLEEKEKEANAYAMGAHEILKENETLKNELKQSKELENVALLEAHKTGSKYHRALRQMGITGDLNNHEHVSKEIEKLSRLIKKTDKTKKVAQSMRKGISKTRSGKSFKPKDLS